MPPQEKSPAKKTITPERYNEIDIVVRNRPEIVSEAQHALAMMRQFGNELHPYFLERNAREAGVKEVAKIPEKNKTKTEQNKVLRPKNKKTSEQLSLIGKDGKSIAGNQGKKD